MDANEIVTDLFEVILAVNMGGEYTAPDWNEYVDVEAITSTVAEVKAEVAALKAELVPYLDAETVAAIAEAEADIIAELAAVVDEETIDLVKPYVEQLVYSLVSYAVETAEAVETIKAINEDATILLVGMYNPLSGVVVKMNGAEIDLGEYFDYVVEAVDVYNLAYAFASGNVTVVDVSEASVDGAVIDVDALMGLAAQIEELTAGLAGITNLDQINAIMAQVEAIMAQIEAELAALEAILANTANEEGVAYIAEQIAAVLAVADHDFTGAYVYNTTDHWHVCANGCEGVIADKAAHVYDNDSDAICNVCDYERTISGGSGSGSGSGGGGGAAGAYVFIDVPPSHTFYKEIMWAHANGYVEGYGDDTYRPADGLTRQHVWMVLARMSGEKPANMAEAREWAMATGVSDGTNPGALITRQQMVAMFYRYANLKGYDVSAEADMNVFPDGAAVSDYAKDPMEWAIAEGIIKGYTDGTLKAAGLTNRGQFAAVLYRFDKAVK